MLIDHGSTELSLPLQAIIATSQFADVLAMQSGGTCTCIIVHVPCTVYVHV